MNQETLDKLNNALAALIEGSVDGLEWAGEQLPELVKQILAWKLAESIAVNLICVAIIFVYCYLSSKAFRYLKINYPGPECDNVLGIDWGIGFVFCIVNIVFAVAILIVASVGFNLDWIQIWLAPDVYLIEYAAKLVK